MECIICGKKISKKNNFAVCKECNKILDMLYRKNPEDKEFALKLFRDSGRKKK